MWNFEFYKIEKSNILNDFVAFPRGIKTSKEQPGIISWRFISMEAFTVKTTPLALNLFFYNSYVSYETYGSYDFYGSYNGFSMYDYVNISIRWSVFQSQLALHPWSGAMDIQIQPSTIYSMIILSCNIRIQCILASWYIQSIKAILGKKDLDHFFFIHSLIYRFYTTIVKSEFARSQDYCQQNQKSEVVYHYQNPKSEGV